MMSGDVEVPSYADWQPPPEVDLIRVDGEIVGDGSNGGVEVTGVWRTRDFVTKGLPGVEHALLLQLLDATGAVLASAWAEWHYIHFRLMDGGCRVSPSGGFHAQVPPLAGGVTLRLLKEQKEVWRRDAPSPAPEIESVWCNVDQERGEIRWTDRIGSGARYEAKVTWSQPLDRPVGGRRQRGGHLEPIEVTSAPRRRRTHRLPLPRGGFVFDAFYLPPGEVEIEVEIGDGFHTVRSVPVVATVPNRPLRVLLETEIDQGRIAIAARAAVCDWDLPGDEAFRWYLDGARVTAADAPNLQVMSGRLLLLHDVAPGDHQVRVEAVRDGQSATETLVVCPPEQGS